MSVTSVAWDIAGSCTFLTSQWLGDPEKCQWPQWPMTLPGNCHFPNGPVTQWTWDLSVASVATGLCQATGTFPTAHWLGHLEICQWPQWPGTLPGHWHFPNSPVTRWPWEISEASVDWSGILPGPWHFPNGPLTRWPWEMSVASVARDIAGQLALSPMARWTSDLEKCHWPGTLRGHWHFPNVPVTKRPREMSVAREIAMPMALSQRPSDAVALRNVSGLIGLGHYLATGTFPTS